MKLYCTNFIISIALREKNPSLLEPGRQVWEDELERFEDLGDEHHCTVQVDTKQVTRVEDDVGQHLPRDGRLWATEGRGLVNVAGLF